MRILWVKANKILPVHSGGDIRSYNIARHLAAHHNLAFFSYYDGPPDQAYEKALGEHFPGAICVCTGDRNDTVVRRGLDYVRKISDRAPYAVSRFASRAVASKIARWYSEQAFDVAVCDFLDAAVNFPKELSIPTVLFQHNVESEIWRRHATNESGGLKKLVYRLEFSKMLRFEQQMVKKFHHVIAVSEHDSKVMGAWGDGVRLRVVPTGVDTEQFCLQATDQEKSLVVFVGAMDWEPNVDAVTYFCAEIWPHIVSKVPAARFRIVGRNPDRRVHALAGSSVEVTGRVPSVVDHLREAAVVVVPLRVGGGTRLKIYEAMAAGKAVVSTTVGAEGLDVHHGKDIVLADSAGSFAESVVALLSDTDSRRKQGRVAAELAAKFGWPVIARRFGEVLADVVDENAGVSCTGSPCGESRAQQQEPERVVAH